MNLPESCRNGTPPPRLTEQEVLDLSGLSKATLSSWKAKGKFPKKLYYTKRYGSIYSGAEVFTALGYTQTMDNNNDPFYNCVDG